MKWLTSARADVYLVERQTRACSIYDPLTPAPEAPRVNTRLPSPILFGVWHPKWGVGGGGVYCAMVVQEYYNKVGFAGGGQQQTNDLLPQ